MLSFRVVRQKQSNNTKAETQTPRTSQREAKWLYPSKASPGSGDKEERVAGTIRISSPGACKCSSRVCCSLIHPRCWRWSRDLEPVPKPSVPSLCSVVIAGPSPCFLIRNTQFYVHFSLWAFWPILMKDSAWSVQTWMPHKNLLPLRLFRISELNLSCFWEVLTDVLVAEFC